MQMYEGFFLPPNSGDRQREHGLYSYQRRWNTTFWDEWITLKKYVKGYKTRDRRAAIRRRKSLLQKITKAL